MLKWFMSAILMLALCGLQAANSPSFDPPSIQAPNELVIDLRDDEPQVLLTDLVFAGNLSPDLSINFIINAGSFVYFNGSTVVSGIDIESFNPFSTTHDLDASPHMWEVTMRMQDLCDSFAPAGDPVRGVLFKANQDTRTGSYLVAFDLFTGGGVYSATTTIRVIDSDPPTVPPFASQPDSSAAQPSALGIDPNGTPVAGLQRELVPLGPFSPADLGDLGTRAIVTYINNAWELVDPALPLNDSQGYWIEPGPALAGATVEAAALSEIVRPLQVGWNSFSLPFGAGVSVPWDLDGLDSNGNALASAVTLRLTTAQGLEQLTLSEAYARGLVEHVAWSLGSAGYQHVVDASGSALNNDVGSTALHQLESGKSYLFKALSIPAGGTLELVVQAAGQGNG